MKNKNESKSGAISLLGLLGVLFVVFLVLKLTGTIGWSWWWATAPLWGGVCLVLLAFALAAIIMTLAATVQSRRRFQTAVRPENDTSFHPPNERA